MDEHWKKLYEASQDECKRLAESIKQLESERDTPDTWERIEEDARKAMSLYSMPHVVMTLIARCKALAGEAS